MKSGLGVVMLFGEAFVRLVSGAGLVVIVSRWGGTDLLGVYSLVLAWLLLFQVFVSLGIQELTIREIGGHPSAEEKYVAHFVIIGAASSLVGTCLLPLVVLPMNYAAETTAAITVGALTLLPATMITICRSAFLAHRRIAEIVSIALIESVLTLAVNCYLVVTGASVVLLVVTIVCAKFVSALTALVILHRRVIKLKPMFDWQFCQDLSRPLFTFALSNSLGLLSQRINIILLSVVSTVDMVGLFAAASKLLELVLIIPSIFAQLTLANLSRSYGEFKALDHAYLDRIVTFMLLISVPAAASIAVLAPTIMPLIFGDEFQSGATVLRLLMLFFIFENADTIMGVMLKAAGRQGVDVRLYAANPVSNVTLTILLAPILGAAGAATGKLVGTLTSSALRLNYLARNLDVASNRRMIDVALLLDAALLVSLPLIASDLPIVLRATLYAASAGPLVYVASVYGLREVWHVWARHDS